MLSEFEKYLGAIMKDLDPTHEAIARQARDRITAYLNREVLHRVVIIKGESSDEKPESKN